ncbi:MAG: protein translocase subunit SecDF [Chitinophagales bacterium]
MQAKGLVRFFGIALVLVCLYQLSFTFFTSMVNGRADDYAADKVDAQNITDVEERDFRFAKERKNYLDSVSNEPVVPLLGYTYNQVKERQLNLGLDLQGGMSVVLQITLDELIRSMALDQDDQVLNDALAKAKELQKDSQDDFVTLFGRAVKEVDPSATLGSIFASADRDDINFNSTDDEVLTIIRTEADQAIERTFNIIRTRIDKFGVTQPNINLQPATGRIIVELPGADDPEGVRNILQATAKLEFWETYENNQDFGRWFQEANEIVKAKEGIEADSEADATSTNDSTAAETIADAAATDSASADSSDISLLDGAEAEGDSLSVDQFRAQNPFYAVFQQAPNVGPVIGYVAKTDREDLQRYLEMEDVQAVFPDDMKFLLESKSVETDEGNEIYPIYAMRSSGRGGEMTPSLDGGVITDASQDIDINQKVIVNMRMNSEGASDWAKITRDNLQKSVAIVLDDVVYTAPTIQSEIRGGSSQITGNFTIAEAQNLANIIKSGKLPAPARIVEEAVVGPSLGKESIRNGLLSLLAGIILVLLFMIFYYNSGGIIANIALLLNLFFVIGVLASLGATLTLPGMAGIVLTIGMAVDANVIIFERIREELAKGVGVKKAIIDGYTKSYSAIIDANLTTLITAAVLYYFGLGPVLGFATVLMIGIFSSLFTAILITRLITDWRLGKGKDIKYDTAFSANRFKNLNIDFISLRRMSYMATVVLIVLGLASFLFKGFELGVDFKGGRTYVVEFNDSVDPGEITGTLKGTFDDVLVRTYGASNQVKIGTSHQIDSDDPETDNEVVQMLHKGLSPMLGGVSFDDFQANNLQSSQKVGPTIADDIKSGAVYATIFALLGIFLYILARFRKKEYGFAAVLTIAHDTFFLLAIFSLLSGFLPFSLEINQNFIAALLTVIGYSINDTVVVFDRIREYVQLNPKRDRKEVVNEAVNSTLSRTLITSLTTLIVVLILFIFGGEVIRGFSFALLLGIIVGTYSSIFIATPIMVDLSNYFDERKAKKQPAVAPATSGRKGRKKKQSKKTA